MRPEDGKKNNERTAKVTQEKLTEFLIFESESKVETSIHHVFQGA